MNKTVIFLVVAIVAIGGASALYYFNNDSTGDKSNQESTAQLSDTKDAANNTEQVKEEELEDTLVDSFPAQDIPLYPGDIKRSTAGMDSFGEKPQWGVDVVTSDSYDMVDEAVRQAYESGDWSITSDNKGPLGGAMLIVRNSKYAITITYDDMGEDGTSLHYGVSQL